MNEYKLLLKNINKSLTVNFTLSENILKYILFLLPQKRYKKKKCILKDISFTLKTGEIIGLIGSNGSGKSTLLRIISGIYKADSGIIKTNGNILYINGFGIGLKNRLTMRDNIYLIGSIMGLKEKEIKLIIPQIADFSDLNEYLDTKIYQFSQGMQLRLSFSTIIFCMQNNKLDIVLLDEVFTSGGDLNFQKKASDKMTELIKEGAAIILVSHNLQDIRKYCNKTILLEKGQIIEIGNTNEVLDRYIKNKLI